MSYNIARGFGPFRARVESKRVISIFEMQKFSAEEHHLLHSYRFWTKSGIHLEWKKALGDRYLELLERGPRNTQSTFDIVTTPCNYGGLRWWLVCPDCKRRVAKLYEDKDNFSCRICLDLEYSTHRLNYRSMGPMVRRIMQYDSRKSRSEYSFYKGKMTKRAERDEKLRRRVEMGTLYVLSTVKKWEEQAAPADQSNSES